MTETAQRPGSPRPLSAVQRLPPHGPEREAALLGAIEVHPDLAGDVLSVAGPSAFYDVTFSNIAAAMVAVVERGDSPDPHALNTELRRAGLLEGLTHDGATGAAVLVTLMTKAAMRNEMAQLARIIADDAEARSVIARAARLSDAGYAGDLMQAAQIVTETLDDLGGAVRESSWKAVDLQGVIDAGLTPSAPTIFRRTDGEALLYPGRTHAFNAPPETWKTLIALVVVAEQVKAGHQVGYYDFEDAPEAIVGRLLALGVPAADLVARFHYWRPDEPLGAAARAQVIKTAKAHNFSLVVIDGVAEYMALNGLNENDNTDVATFLTALPRAFERDGASVLLIDHVTKDKETAGRYARGAGHKLAGLSGAAYSFEVSKPFGRGGSGTVRISVTKDRPGWVRRAAVGSRVAEVDISSNDDGSEITVNVRPPQSTTTGTFRPTYLMERLSRVLEIAAEPMTVNEILTATKGKTDARTQALRCLVEEEFVEMVKEGSAHRHRSLKPYREPVSEPEHPADLEAEQAVMDPF